MPSWGSVGAELERHSPADYPGDGSGATILEPPARANPRDISNALSAQGATSVPNARGLSAGLWQWGQFLDHDIDLTGTDAANGTADIPVDGGDILAPGPIHFSRSNFAAGTGTSAGNPRQQVNEITAYIDGSNVYGSDITRANELRTFVGGELKTSAGNLLPLNSAMLPNAGGTDPSMFLAGDVRSNEQVGLTAMHTLFVREHNRLAGLLTVQNPLLTDEQLYQTARRIVGAELQIITYNEFLPMLLGPGAPSATAYAYDSAVNAGIANEFSTAFYRFGHSMLDPELLLVNNAGVTTDTLSLRDAFFDPDYLKADPTRVDRLLMGLSVQQAQEVDTLMVDDVRSFLFGPPGAGGMDLAALNLQRARDHGLGDYNTLRAAYGLSPVASFSDITTDATLEAELAAIYGDVNNIDPWVGGLAEDHLPGASVGPLVEAALVDQFTRLRDGDRFFYTADAFLAGADVTGVIDLDQVSLTEIVEVNTAMSGMRSNYFAVPEPSAAGLLIVGVLVSAAGLVAFGSTRR